jgi:hypothetical protein
MITPCIFCRNEEYWIHYVLKPLLTEFPMTIVLDTGSRDSTKSVIKALNKEVESQLVLLEHDYGDIPNKIGNSPNILREACPTEWMLLVGGDEIWPVGQLKLVKDHVQRAEANTEVAMVLGRNVVWENGWYERDSFNADRLFRPEVRWDNVKYPYEGHYLERRLKRNAVEYWDVYYWHARYLRRSTLDSQTFYRSKKQHFFPWDGELKPITEQWFGEPTYSNPYMEGLIHA